MAIKLSGITTINNAHSCVQYHYSILELAEKRSSNKLLHFFVSLNVYIYIFYLLIAELLLRGFGSCVQVG